MRAIVKYFFLFFLLFVFSCKAKHKKNTMENTEVTKAKQEAPSETLVFSIKKTPCFGTCQVYNMQIYSTGKVVYNGEKHVRKIGKFERTITIEELKGLIDAFEAANFWDFKDLYTEQVTDMPTTFVTFVNNGNTKVVEDYFNAPKELKSLELMLQRVADEGEWKKTEEH